MIKKGRNIDKPVEGAEQDSKTWERNRIDSNKRFKADARYFKNC